MKPKLVLCILSLLLCGSFVAAGDKQQKRPMTTYEKAITNINDVKELKAAYDALETDYDRRYFLHALPGYFNDHEIKNVPGWIKTAVIDGIESDDPQYCREAVVTAGALKINCSNELIKLYEKIPATFGGYMEMLQTSALISLSKMDNSVKKDFLYKILNADDMPLGLSTFNVLLDVISMEPDLMYSNKLTELSSIFDDRIAEIEAGTDEKKKEYQLQKLKKVKNKIEKVRTNVMAGGGK